jgi:hypothetical protein
MAEQNPNLYVFNAQQKELIQKGAGILIAVWTTNIQNDVIGLHIHSMNGILAPGNYFDYLNSEYNRDNSKVISKRVYTKEDFN